MEPFVVQCSTCQSRIRVRTASMIGQLVNCPKCESMIMITAPPKVRVEERDRQSVDSMALTQDAISPDLVPALKPTVGEDEKAGAEEYRLAADDPFDQVTPPVQPALPMTSEFGPDDQPLLPSDEWTSEAATRSRQYLLVGFLALSGVVLSVVLFVGFLRWYRSIAEQENVPPLAVVQPVDEVAESPHVEEPSTDTPAEQNDLTSPLGSNGQETTDESVTVDGAQLGNGVGIPPDTRPVEDSASDNDPLELPDPLSDNMLDSEPDATEAKPEKTVRELLPNDRLREFAEIFDRTVQPMLPPVGVIASAPPLTAEELGLTGGGTQTIEAIDWNAKGAVVLPGLIFSDAMPLSQMMNLWTQISGVPSVVDLDSLAAGGLDLNKSGVSIKVRDVTVAQVADMLASRLGLQVDVKENRYLEFRAPEKLLAEQLPTSTSIVGLADNEAAQTWLVESLERLLPDTEGQWSVSDGQLTCDRGRVDLMTWFRVVRLLGNWRSAAGLPREPGNDAAGRTLTRFVEPQSLNSLDDEVLEVMAQSLPVGQSIARVCSAAGVQCWIDWPSVGSVGLGPATTAAVVTHRRSLKQILADYADRFSLVVAIQDENTLWITSSIAYRTEPRLYVMASEGRTEQQWQQQLRRLTPLDSEGNGILEVIATPDGDYLLVRCCRPTLGG